MTLFALLVAAASLVVAGFALRGVEDASAETGTTDKTTQTIGDDTSNFVVPYDGYLMLDSTPLNGTLDLQFKLYETASGGSAEWSETQTVTFYNGRFSVGLGSVTRINEDLLDADQLYLEIALDDGSGNLVTLSGRQAIEPVPYAIWSAHAANLTVAGSATIGDDLTVTDDFSVDGAVRLGNYDSELVDVQGQLNVTGNTTIGDGSGRTHTVNDALTATKTFAVQGNTTLGDATSDTLTINGTTTTNGSVIIGNSATTNRWLHVTGTDLYLGTSNSSGRGDGGRALIQGNGDTLYVNYNGDFSGGTVINGGTTTVSGNLAVSGNAALGNASTDAHTVNGSLRGSSGYLDLGLVLRTCNWGGTSYDYMDCFCATSEHVIAGGTYGTQANNHAIRESKAVYSSSRGQWGWRTSCIDRDDGQGDAVWCGSGSDESVYVLCAPFAITNGGATGVEVFP